MTETEQRTSVIAAAAAQSRTRRLAGPVLAATSAAAALVVLATVNPNEPGHYPTCPLLFLTGWYCPGCGSLRALHDLAHLDVAAAWGMNPLLVLAVPFIAVSWLAWLVRSSRRASRTRAAPAWSIYALLVVVVAYGVARNVPVLAPWLAP